MEALEELLASPWNNAVQYVLIVLAAALSPLISAGLRGLERANAERADMAKRITIEQSVHPMIISFETIEPDVLHTMTVRSKTNGLLVGEPVELASKPRSAYAPPDQPVTPPMALGRSVKGLKLSKLMDLSGRATGHARGTSVDVVGEPGCLEVEVRWSNRCRATRIIAIHNPASRPDANQEAETTQ